MLLQLHPVTVLSPAVARHRLRECNMPAYRLPNAAVIASTVVIASPILCGEKKKHREVAAVPIYSTRVVGPLTALARH